VLYTWSARAMKASVRNTGGRCHRRLTLEDVEGLHLLLDLSVLVGATTIMSDKLQGDTRSTNLLFFSLLDHSVNFLLAQSTLLVGDDDALGLTGRLVGGRDLHDTVGVNLEGDLDLGLTSRRGGDVGQVELAEHVVVLGHGTFTFVDLDLDGGLVVDSGGEDLRLLGGDDGVSGTAKHDQHSSRGEEGAKLTSTWS
jgi:hypothetical protein